VLEKFSGTILRRPTLDLNSSELGCVRITQFPHNTYPCLYVDPAPSTVRLLDSLMICSPWNTEQMDVACRRHFEYSIVPERGDPSGGALIVVPRNRIWCCDNVVRSG